MREKMITRLSSNLFVATVILTAAALFSEPANASAEKDIRALGWIKSPSSGEIGDKAKIKLSGDLSFLGETDTKRFLELNGNPGSYNHYTIANLREGWFAIFTFRPEGYVKDDEKIDADALLKTLKEGNEKSLEDRKRQGLPLIYLEGWHTPPHYDVTTKRLEWATKLRTQDKEPLINYTTRILGRSGFMSVVLVSDPDSLDRDIKSFKTALKDFDYNSGEKYSEWKQGDKVAAYGLGALVVGGAAAAVASKGGFKLIWLAILGAIAAIVAFFKKFVSKKKD
jgi:uncharacterized membrane-anchored protein